MTFRNYASMFLCLFALSDLPKSETASEEGSHVALDDYDGCAITSLYCVARLGDVAVDYERVRQVLGPGKDGLHSLAELTLAARELGMSPLPVKVTRSQLQSLPLPAIVHMRSSYFRRGQPRPHFAVLLDVSPDGARVLDAPFPAALFQWSEFESLWTGNILVFAESDESADRLRVALDSQHGGGTLGYLRSSGILLSVVVLALAALDIVVTWRARKRSRQNLAASSDHAEDSPAKRPRGRRVGRLVLCASILLVPLVISAAAWRLAQPARPDLEVPNGVVDLGEFEPGSSDSAVVLRNRGNRTLLIRRVNSSCACATPDVPREIPPRGQVTMRLSLTTRSGNNNADIVVLSNDPDGPQRLGLRWRGSRTPQLFPPRVSAVNASLGKPWQGVVHLTYPGGQFAVLPKVLAMDCPLPDIHVDVGKNDPLAFRTARGLLSQKTTVGYLDLIVRVDSPKHPDVVESVCTVSVEYGEQTYELELPIRVCFEDRVKLRPQRLLLSATEPAGILGKVRIVRVETRNGSPFLGDLEIAEKPNWLECRLETGDGGQRHLAVAVETTSEHLPCKGTVILREAAEPSVEAFLDVSVLCLKR